MVEVTEDIRQPEVDALVSPVAKIKEVNYLCVVQREIALLVLLSRKEGILEQ